ncbi:lysozyme inhibitor LprI family protein [Shinella sp. G-2]
MIFGIRLLLPLAALAASVSFAAAQDETALDCGASTAQPDLNDCAYRAYEAEDAALNAAYKKAMARAKALDTENTDPPLYADPIGAADALKNAQRAWIGYRDGHCVLAGFQARGGQAEPMLVSGCLADLTRKRTDELKEFLETDY